MRQSCLQVVVHVMNKAGDCPPPPPPSLTLFKLRVMVR